MKQSAPGAPARNNLFLSTGKKAVLILLVGLFASAIVWFFLNNNYTSLLTRRASTFARVFEPAQTERLRDASLADSDTAYEEVRAKLADLESIYEETRFVYLMARENDTITFLADSEPTDSPSYSARGDLYKGATEKLKALFNGGEAFTEGPVSDEYGIWYSSLAPIKNNEGKVVAIVGIDVPAIRYVALVAGISLLPLLLAVVSVIVVIIYDRSRRSRVVALMFKGELASLASHELQDPINGLRWAEETLLKNDLNESQRKVLYVMYESTLRLQENLENIVQLANVGPRPDKLSFTVFNLADTIKGVVQTEQLAAEMKGVYITFSDDWPSLMPVFGDATKLRTVFNTIVSNAIRDAREQTAIELSYTRDGKYHVIHIRGQGLGIAAVDLPHVFESTYRASNPIRRSRGGGMGLYVARNFVEQHGGKLSIESIENDETIAHVSIPLSDRPLELEVSNNDS